MRLQILCQHFLKSPSLLWVCKIVLSCLNSLSFRNLDIIYKKIFGFALSLIVSIHTNFCYHITSQNMFTLLLWRSQEEVVKETLHCKLGTWCWSQSLPNDLLLFVSVVRQFDRKVCIMRTTIQFVRITYVQTAELPKSESTLEVLQSRSLCFHHNCVSGLCEGGQGYHGGRKMLREFSHFLAPYLPGQVAVTELWGGENTSAACSCREVTCCIIQYLHKI